MLMSFTFDNDALDTPICEHPDYLLPSNVRCLISVLRRHFNYELCKRTCVELCHDLAYVTADSNESATLTQSHG